MPTVPNGGGGEGSATAATQVPLGGPSSVDETQPTAEQQQGMDETAATEPGANDQPTGG